MGCKLRIRQAPRPNDFATLPYSYSLCCNTLSYQPQCQMEAPHTDNANIDPTLLALDQPCHTSTQYGLAADTVGVPMGVNNVHICKSLPLLF